MSGLPAGGELRAFLEHLGMRSFAMHRPDHGASEPADQEFVGLLSSSSVEFVIGVGLLALGLVALLVMGVIRLIT